MITEPPPIVGFLTCAIGALGTLSKYRKGASSF